MSLDKGMGHMRPSPKRSLSDFDSIPSPKVDGTRFILLPRIIGLWSRRPYSSSGRERETGRTGFLPSTGSKENSPTGPLLILKQQARKEDEPAFHW